MHKFSEHSLARLATCHPDLQRLAIEVIKEVDCTVVCGHRCEADQRHDYETGASKKDWPDSKHNSMPSMAIDLAPYIQGHGIPWSDHMAFVAFAATVLRVAKRIGVAIRWGGDWNGNGDRKDQTFHDLPHFELKG